MTSYKYSFLVWPWMKLLLLFTYARSNYIFHDLRAFIRCRYNGAGKGPHWYNVQYGWICGHVLNVVCNGQPSVGYDTRDWAQRYNHFKIWLSVQVCYLFYYCFYRNTSVIHIYYKFDICIFPINRHYGIMIYWCILWQSLTKLNID